MNLATLNVSPASLTLIIGLGAAVLTGMQAIVTLGMMGWINSRKELRDAQRKIEADIAAAKLKKEEKEEDYARQDLVAKRVADAADKAADAAKLLLDAQAATTAGTDEVARRAADADARIAEQLQTVIEGNQKIHTLVNSDMTAARTAERDAVVAQVLALRRMYALSTKIGMPITSEELEMAAVLEARIIELNQILADRLAAQHAVDAVSAANSRLVIVKPAPPGAPPA